MNSSPDAGTKGCLVLIVEDEPHVQQMAVQAIEYAGHRTILASCAAEAMERLHELHHSIDLVVTDVKMPGEMDGAELAFTIRSRWPTIGLIVASGYFDPKLSRLPIGCAFLAKPYRLGEFLHMVEQQLGFLGRTERQQSAAHSPRA